IQANFAGVDLQEKIRNFIKYAYQNWGTEYVLLGGDDSVIPHRGFYGYVNTNNGPVIDNDIPADLYYAGLDGTWNDDGDTHWGEPEDNPDFIAEVYVGRAPVETTTETTNFVNKVIAFETADKPKVVQLHESRLESGNNPDATTLPEKCAQWVPPDYTIDRLYEENGTVTKTDWISKFNAGRIIVQHEGHGNWSYYLVNYENGGRVDWYTWDASSLTNSFYPIHTSVACYSGAFDYNDCLAEKYVLNPNGGTIACMLNSRYGWYSSDDASAFSGEFVEMEFYGLFQNGSENLGKMLQLAKQHFVSDATNYNVYRWCYYEINLLGDPETPALTKRSLTEPVHNIDKNTYYDTIQAAINDADNGNTILVSNGTYNESIVVNKSINLYGEDKNITIIDGGSDSNVVTIEASNVNISGFTIRNGGEEGIYMEGVSYCNISNNIICNNGGAGVILNLSSNNTIYGNIVHNNTYDGILLENASYNNIIGNTACYNGVGNNGEGILLMYSSHNIIKNNTAYKNGEDGIILEPYASYNNITGNEVYENADCGILISHSSDNNKISDNHAYNNTYDGLLIESSSNETVSKNAFHNNGEEGIYLSSVSSTIIKTNRICNNSGYGIYINSSSGNTIYNNYFNNTNNAFDNGNNKWNTTKTAGANIIGGAWLGGNYWSDYNGIDTNGDGLGDTMLPYNSNGNIATGDMLPLVASNYAPVADFIYSPLNPTCADVITFIDKSYDNDGYIVNWTWDFGDGNISYEQNPQHQYASAGTYNVSLTVRDSDGATDSTYKIINVENAPPVADFSYSPCDLYEIQFNDKSYDSDGSIVNWTWDFGDGNISYEQNPKHKYAEQGTYNVTLIVTDNDGSVASMTKTIGVWTHRKPINLWVSSGKTPAYYQVLLNISYNTSMNPDSSDLRFIRYADNVTELDYWIERKVDGKWANIWVEIADEITTQNKTLAWMYYGNEYAASASNGSATFLFFDD
ncbi:MAG: DUF2341 domain-containing protein, partial [Thermoplasmata archaeon]|nr:DUF2341 domain-containing protein [Thermoplasmata archaeon]